MYFPWESDANIAWLDSYCFLRGSVVFALSLDNMPDIIAVGMRMGVDPFPGAYSPEVDFVVFRIEGFPVCTVPAGDHI